MNRLLLVPLLLLVTCPNAVRPVGMPFGGLHVPPASAPARAGQASAPDLSGLVRDRKGPLANASVVCRRNNHTWQTHTNRQGAYRLRLSSGSYYCTATARNHRPSSQSRARISTGRLVRLNFTLSMLSVPPVRRTPPTPVPRPTAVPAPTLGPSGPQGGETCDWQTGAPTFTDSNARYFQANVRADPAVILTISGTFPAARFVSIGAYNGATTANAAQGALFAGLTDTQFPADPGSINPYVVGTQRAVGTFTLHVVFGPQPSSPLPGTLYVNAPSGTYVVLIYRLYLPDTNADNQGNVPLPIVTARLASSGAPTGCPITATIPVEPAASATPTVTTTVVATGTPQTPVATPQTTTPTATPASASALPSSAGFIRLGGAGADFFGNIDGAYLGSSLPASSNLYVLRFKPPTTPHTLGGAPIDLSAQVRYWSLCVYDITTKPISCTADEQAPLDGQGYVTFVMGPTWAKPPNATAAYSAVWVDLGASILPLGNYMVLRELEPSPLFGASTFAVPTGVAPDAYMGAYTPKVITCSTTQFQQTRCFS